MAASIVTEPAKRSTKGKQQKTTTKRPKQNPDFGGKVEDLMCNLHQPLKREFGKMINTMHADILEQDIYLLATNDDNNPLRAFFESVTVLVPKFREEQSEAKPTIERRVQ